MARIGVRAFNGCTSLTDVTFNSIPEVGNYAFSYCTNLNTITLALTDDSYVAADKGYFPTLTAEPTYTRTLTTEWETIVVPFDVTITDNDNYEFYNFSGVNGSTLNVIKATGTIAAGTPVLIRKKCDGDYNLTLTASYMVVSTAINNPTAVNGLTLTGTYATASVASGAGYVFDGSKFKKTTAATDVTPFHAYLQGSIDGVDELVIPHTHTWSDDTHTYCTTCDHSFIYYTATSKVTPNETESLPGYSDANNTFDSTTKEGVIELTSKLTSIGENAFQECTSLQTITIPSSVTSIGNYAFYDCENLQSITIPSGVTSIGENAFICLYL